MDKGQGSDQMNKWEQELWEFKIAELIVESELVVRHKTQESHLPLTFVSSAEGKTKLRMDGGKE